VVGQPDHARIDEPRKDQEQVREECDSHVYLGTKVSFITCPGTRFDSLISSEPNMAGRRSNESPWIRNTSRHPDEEVTELVRSAIRGIDMQRVCVNVKGGHGLSARAYDGVPSISNAPRGARYLVTIKIGTGVRFPVGPYNRNGQSPDEVGPRNRFPFFTYTDWREWLVSAAAHEALHVHQYRHGKPRSEIECERFAAEALQRYRDETLPQ